VVQQLFLLALSVLAFDCPKLMLLVGPHGLRLQQQFAIDHFMLRTHGFFHPAHDVLVGFVFGEGQGVDLVAGDGFEVVDFVENL